MYKRQIQDSIISALQDTSVVVINGARQTGKSTFCKQLIKDGVFKAQYFTFDDPTTLSAAQSDPGAFVEGLAPHVVLDEVQRVPKLLLTIKKFVDELKITTKDEIEWELKDKKLKGELKKDGS